MKLDHQDGEEPASHYELHELNRWAWFWLSCMVEPDDCWCGH